ncbi:MAG: dephospho-CoA kinase [Ardenticatenaceae bacterium]|nr:dephospho-CoA kinase [Ardenticatenaceae bacterium]
MSEQTTMKQITGKLIIGLTGNIATGKSAVMHLAADRGALTIDADAVVHEILNNDAEMQTNIAVAFGSRVRREDGRIDRKILGNIVFNDPAALRDLEKMLHPAVRQHIYQQIDETKATTIMIEAIKLLDGDLFDACHQVWVTRCSEKRQMERLQICRGLDKEAAEHRIHAQSSQEEKVALADVVIETDGLMVDTEKQFDLFWTRLPNPATVEAKELAVVTGKAAPSKPMRTPPSTEAKTEAPAKAKPDLSRLKGAGAKLRAKQEREKAVRREADKDDGETAVSAAETPPAPPPLPAVDAPFNLVLPDDRPADLEVRRARPSDIPSILLLIHKATDGVVRLKRADLLMALSERSYFIGQVGAQISAVVGWSIESGVTKIDQIYIHPPEAAGLTGPAIIEEIGKSAFQHMCELLVVFLPANGPNYLRELFESQDYRTADLNKMVGSWRQAIQEAQPPHTDFMIKVLAERESHPV